MLAFVCVCVCDVHLVTVNRSSANLPMLPYNMYICLHICIYKALQTYHFEFLFAIKTCHALLKYILSVCMYFIFVCYFVCCIKMLR